MMKEIRGFSLLFIAIVMIGTIYIYTNNDDGNGHSKNIYNKEVHEETMAVEQDTNAWDAIVEEKLITSDENADSLNSVTLVE